ncbi:S8 family peptidase [Aspergillus undulatus]|uniref:S8 family peptidase n=1 Tax=Aspergillus undulatus TaxID=1810928 RepID=UPI003CCD20BF
MAYTNGSISQLAENFEDLDLDNEPVQTEFIGPMAEGGRRRSLDDVVQDLDTGKVKWEDLNEEDRLSLTHRDGKNTSRPTLLHRMAENWASKDFRVLPMSDRRKIALFLLDRAMPHANKRDDPILTVAIGYYSVDFVDFVIANRPKMLQDFLTSTDGKGMNCLHRAFKETMHTAWKELIKLKKTDNLQKTMSVILTLLGHADSAAITAKDDLDNTPIHYAMDYRLCHIPGEYRCNGKDHKYEHLIRLLLEKAKLGMDNVEVLFNKKHQSPYGYYFYVMAALENQNRKEKTPEPSTKDVKPKAGEKVKDDLREPKRGGVKLAASEPSGRTTLSVIEANSQQTTPHTKANAPSAPKGVPKPPRDFQNHTGSFATLTTGEKGNDLAGTKMATIVRRPTSTLDTANDGTPERVVPEATRSAESADPESLRSQSKIEKSAWPGEEEKEAAKSILGFLKCFFIRNSSDRDAKDLLYGKVASGKTLNVAASVKRSLLTAICFILSDINLFFDASHLRGKRVDDVVRLIEKVSKAGGFEDTLSYVRIPRLIFESQNTQNTQQTQNIANEKRTLKKSPNDKEVARGRETLIRVFDELVRVKVQKILRLHVEDNGDEWAHTDTAIEKAIKGYSKYSGGVPRKQLEIGEWDWCKPDINLDVIKNAAPSVEHIHLHWSGNQTVLHAWASSESGIPLLCRNSKSLSEVTLYAYRGLESSERRKAAVDLFNTLIEERTNKKVKVTPKFLSKNVLENAKSGGEKDTGNGDQSEKPRSHAWIETMERFRTALLKMYRGGVLGEPRRVKVALIDDGIDLDEFNTYSNTARCTGVSYCSNSEQGENAWWKSTNGHGTIMANMISRINPWVVLDVIKIQSSPSYIHGEGTRSISPKSAADAINAAVMHHADIISISWTITDLEYRMSLLSESLLDEEGNKKRADQSEMELLRTAIKNAVEGDKRLLICSAADDIRLVADKTLPYGQAPNHVLCIGSAGPLANRDPGARDGGSINYYLPGNQVAEEQRAHSSKSVVYHNGSSVSTALAAGLASLIMYCAHCLHLCGPGDEYQAWALALRNQGNMKKAFNSINQYLEWKDDEKIVPVWGIFGDKCGLLEKASTKEEKIKVLKDLVSYLCHDLK